MKESRYNVQTGKLIRPTENEINFLLRLFWEAKHHSSGGSYNMLAAWVRRSQRVIGRNELVRPANTISNDYPDICGVHAELNLWHKHKDLKGGTVYLAGRRSNSGTEMSNTACCIYCASLLAATGVKNVIFVFDEKFAKTNPINLTEV